MVTMQEAIETIQLLREALESWPDKAAHGQREHDEDDQIALSQADVFLRLAGVEE